MSEVQSRAVVRRRGEGEYVCMLMFLEETGAIKAPPNRDISHYVCLFVCLFG